MKRLMLGNEAIARGAWEAGVKVAAAYPGTPSTEITEYISKYDEIYSEWSVNEKVSLEVAIGASIAGARSICAMKHVGLNVAADPLFTASYTGVNGGLVVVVADDPGMHSSQNEQDSRHYARAAKLPMLEPMDSSDCKDFVKNAFDISEKYDTPVMIRVTTRIAHSQSAVEVGERQNELLKEYTKNFEKYVMMPAMAKKRHVVVENRMIDLAEFSDTCGLNKIENGSKKMGIIAAGIAYQFAREAFPNASFLKLGMVYPLPDRLIKEFAESVEELYVVEELDPFIEEHIKAMGIKVIGKEKLPLLGEFSAQLIKECISGEKANFESLVKEDSPGRPPVMCPGCPHRGVYHILNKLKVVVSGDIGCYTLGALPPFSSMDTCVCMGASVSMAHGMEKARGKEFAAKTVGILGDSTFLHSGITGLIDIVYNKGCSTIIILDNSITGMTGHQQNPSTGFTIKGEPTRQVNFEKLCQAIGVERISVVDPFDVKEVERVLKEELASDEPSVIIARRPCALLKGVVFEGPLKINLSKCKNCKLCLKAGCPAIIDTGDGMEINSALCVGCGLCVRMCSFNAIGKE